MAKDTITLTTIKSKGIPYWVCRWFDPYSGKKKSKSLGRVDEKSDRQAQKEADLLWDSFDKNPTKRQNAKVMTLGELVEFFISNKTAEGKDEKTVKEYRFVGELLSASIDPNRPINEVTARDAQRFAADLRGGKLEASKAERKGPNGKVFKGRKTGINTGSKYIMKCRTMFKHAMKTMPDDVRTNPFAGLAVPRISPKSWHYVSLEEFEALFKVCPENWKYAFALARLAALSCADMKELRWSQIDFNERLIPYKREKTGEPGQPPICPRLMEILKELKKMKIGDGFVLPRPLPFMNPGRDFEVQAKKAGVVPWKDPFHTCRKSAITDWADGGVPPHVCKGWAAHASIITTLTYYVQSRKGTWERQFNGLGQNPALDKTFDHARQNLDKTLDKTGPDQQAKSA